MTIGSLPPVLPPKLPRFVGLADDERGRRFRFRLWQVSLTALVVGVTGWFVTLGPVSAILALMVAKHVLVAILVMDLGVDAPRQT
ncbi:MAG: hypothetical protein NZ700_04780 [Gemmataceae bacterium]|nr:hypothetical protein [Gemmataceae bacterium]MDW8264058.1 hypothetical protein [Gemmataceae bacterium]